MDEQPMSPEVTVASLASATLVLTGLGLQQLMAPEQPAWSLFEVCGFALAVVPWALLGIMRVIDWSRE